ncbi:MAG: glycosyltransferase [Rhizomicrobium sp.]
MDIAVIAVGSRGDVQPPAALARGLAQRGHKVRFIAPSEFAFLMEGLPVEFCGLSGDVRQILATTVSGDQNPVAILRDLVNGYREVATLWAAQAREYARAAGLLIGIGAASLGAAVMGEALRIPSIVGFAVPVIPTAAFPSPAFPVRLPRYTNRLQHALAFHMLWQFARPIGNRICQELFGEVLPSCRGPWQLLGRATGPVLIAVSPSVIPQPSDWTGRAELTGYWFLDAPAWQPPRGLSDFLQAGSPPIYVGFGSMTMPRPAQMLQTITSAIERVGCRAIVSAGWAGLNPQALSSAIHAIDEVPHDWLFPRVASVVHHGGAGTTAAALRAGKPSVVVPFFSDQPFWGRRLETLGVGAATIPHSRLSADELAWAIERSVRMPAMRAAATRIGAAIRGENGIGLAVDRIEQALHARQRQTRAATVAVGALTAEA